MSGHYRCHTCAATFTAWAPSERHADLEHHHRIDLILPTGGRRNPGDRRRPLPAAAAPGANPQS